MRIFRYIECLYNTRRHGSLGGISPKDYEQRYNNEANAAEHPVSTKAGQLHCLGIQEAVYSLMYTRRRRSECPRSPCTCPTT